MKKLFIVGRLRGSDDHLSLKIWNTGKFGKYNILFNLEAENTGDTEEIFRSLIRQIPPCVKA